MPSNVFIVDDHAVFREGLRKIIELESDLSVCGEAADAPSATQAIEILAPDLVIIDIALEGVSGLELTKTLRSRYPQLRILVLSMHKESLYAERALRAGANGYLMKHENSTKLLETMRLVISGQMYASEALTQKLLQGLGRSGDKGASMDRLGSREFEVFQLIARALSTRQIAEELKISIKTVESHREHIRDKLQLTSTPELVQFAVDWANGRDSLS